MAGRHAARRLVRPGTAARHLHRRPDPHQRDGRDRDADVHAAEGDERGGADVSGGRWVGCGGNFELEKE